MGLWVSYQIIICKKMELSVSERNKEGERLLAHVPIYHGVP